MGKAEPEGYVLVTRGGDQRDAIGIARNPYFANRAMHGNSPVELRQRRKQEQASTADGHTHQQQHTADQTPDH